MKQLDPQLAVAYIQHPTYMSIIHGVLGQQHLPTRAKPIPTLPPMNRKDRRKYLIPTASSLAPASPFWK